MAVERDRVSLPGAGHRRWRRRWVATVPVLVWVCAILAAVQVYRMKGAPGIITGYAAEAPVTLAHLEPGVVRQVLVSLYDVVQEGQMIVAMDDGEERIQLAAMEKDLERLRSEVEAEYARLEAANVIATTDHEDLVRQFAADREAAHLDYLAQLLADARDRAELHGAAVEYEIVKDLAEKDNAPLRELNAAETRFRALQEIVDNNVPLLQRAKEAFEQSDLRWARYLRHESVETPVEPVLAPLRLAVEVRRRDLEEIIRRIDAHVLRAPIDGQITRLDVRAGDHLVAGAPLAMIFPTTAHEVLAYLPEPLARSVAVGASVSVEPLANPRRSRPLLGTVSRLSAAVTEVPVRNRPVPMYPAWGRGLLVTLPEDSPLIPGEAVRIGFVR